MTSNSQNIVPIDLLTKVFAGEASQKEQQELEAWRQAAPENQKEYDALKKLWSITSTSPSKEEINIDAEWNKMEESIVYTEKGRTINLFSRVVSIAASVVIISVLAFIGIQQFRFTTESTKVAEYSTIELPDGSTINLNANSKVSYEKGFGTKHRNITLKGEAYFDVAKNTGLPFIIKANGASVEVTGTQFNIKAYKNQSEVQLLVTEGKVNMFDSRHPTQKTSIVAGEYAVYDRRIKTIRKSKRSNSNDIAWKTRIIEFNNSSLSEVARVLSNAYHITLSVEPEIANCTITVRFEKQDLASVLKVLKSTLNIEVVRENEREFRLTGKGCE